MSENITWVKNDYKITEDTIKNAQEVTLLELQRSVRRAAEKSVVALIRDVGGKRIRLGWLVDGYTKQRLKMTTLIEWLRICNYGQLVITERDYMLFLDSDLIGQLEQAEFESTDIRHKARTLYRRYKLFSDMLDDEIRNLLVELEADDTIERIEAEKLPDVPDDVVKKHTGSEV